MGPDKDFTMVLGESMTKNNKKKERRYGTAYERMTSPGREAWRDHMFTPKSTKPSSKGKVPMKKGPRQNGEIVLEEIEITGKDGMKRLEVREKDFIEDQKEDYSSHNGLNHQQYFNGKREESKYHEEYSEDESYDLKRAFSRLNRESLTRAK